MNQAQHFDSIINEHPYPLLFITISGAHLYGFPSPDSDYDLRGVHILPLSEVAGLYETTDTISSTTYEGGLEIDLVTHDVKKFFGLMLKRNGYVLEQLLSPLVVHATPEFEALKGIAGQCITRHHAHHYLGFARNQWELFLKDDPRRVKPLLYVYRVLLTGIYLMRTGTLEANLVNLNDEFKLPFIPELIQRKVSDVEKATIENADMAFYTEQYERLTGELEIARDETSLPDQPSCMADLNDLLLKIRRL